LVPRVLFGVSPIGLGHATRALVLLEEMKRRGAEVRLFSGGNAADFILQRGIPVDRIVDDPVPWVAHGEMKQAVLWYVRSWAANRRTLPRTRRLFDSYKPDIVVCDEEFSGIVVAGEKGAKRVFISDELRLGFAQNWLARRIEGRVERWYVRLQESVDLLVIPEFGDDVGNRRFVGPIVRAPTKTREETRREYKLPAGMMILFAVSGSGVGRELALKLKKSLDASQDLRDCSLAVTGNRGERMTGESVFDLGVVPDNQDLVAASDLVVSTAGKSTIDEARAAGTPIIVIPIRHHAEQERNAASLGYSSGDAGRLAELVRVKLGQRGAPRKFSGEVRAADEIFSVLEGGRAVRSTVSEQKGLR
jgi:UDP-N-acetylglucosamine--N-acetylmuramyl-(pentapeptide) pyrophosphoryl-undecaprenol N-acetylglucosamine transferase